MNERGHQMDNDYFIVRSGEDGTSIEGPLTESEVLKRIEGRETYYGSNLTFLSEIPENDKGYWDTRHSNPILIIKGEIIVPGAVRVIEKYTLGGE